MSEDKTNFADEALSRLQTAILNGELRPNQRLVESRLAKMLGMSRTPLREAIRQLQLMGYVTVLSNGGVVVTEFTPKQIKEIFEIREALEARAIELACTNASDEYLDKAEEYKNLAAEAVANHDMELYFKYNALLHETLRNGCDNKRLINLTKTLSDLYFDRKLERLMTASEINQMMKHHEMLFDALRKRKKTEAVKILRKHLGLAAKIATERL